MGSALQPQIDYELATRNVDMHSPNSMTLKYSGDLIMALLANRIFIMQLAHPAVGAGVIQFSKFREDPWSRLREIRRSGDNIMLKGHEGAEAEGLRLREMHRTIKGMDSRGQQYHALNPDVYGWVHFLFFEATVTGHRLFGNEIPLEDQDILFLEWKQSGRYFGLRDQDLPKTMSDYWAKFKAMIDSTLEYNEAIDYILSIAENTPIKPSQFSYVPEKVWSWIWQPVGRAATFMTLGSLPERYRNKIAAHIQWSEKDQLRFEKRCKLIRRLFNGLPMRLHYEGKVWRKIAIA